MAEKTKLLVIDVPPPTKRRAERVSYALDKTITWVIETQVLYMQEKMLTERLSSEAHRKLYLRRKLSPEEAFEGPRRQKLKFPDPPEGAHTQVSVKLSEPAARALGNLCAFYQCTQGWMVARIFKGHENFFLKNRLKTDEERALFLAGKWKRPEPPMIDLNGDDRDNDE
jgi:hypothetical protein